MKREILTHSEQDVRDALYKKEILALPAFVGGFSPEALREQVRIATLMRGVMVKHFPHLREAFNSLPELEKV